MAKIGAQVVLSVAVMIVGVAAWYMLPSSKPVPPDAQVLITEAKRSNESGLSADATRAAQEAVATDSRAAMSEYRDAGGRFSFAYPQTLKAGGYEDPSGRAQTITVQNPQAHIGFQVYVTPFTDTDTSITAERVRAELPDIAVSDARSVRVGGADALAFYAEDPNFGASYQVWFIQKGTLYQVSTYRNQAVIVDAMLATWQWGS